MITGKKKVLVRPSEVERSNGYVTHKSGITIQDAGIIYMDEHTRKPMVVHDHVQNSATVASAVDDVVFTMFTHPGYEIDGDEIPEQARQAISCMIHRKGKAPYKHGDVLLVSSGMLQISTKVKRGSQDLLELENEYILAKRGKAGSLEPLFNKLRCEPYWEGNKEVLESIRTYPRLAVVMDVPENKRWLSGDYKPGDVIAHNGGLKCQGFNGEMVMFVPEPNIDVVVGHVSLVAHNDLKMFISAATQYMRGDSRWNS